MAFRFLCDKKVTLVISRMAERGTGHRSVLDFNLNSLTENEFILVDRKITKNYFWSRKLMNKRHWKKGLLKFGEGYRIQLNIITRMQFHSVMCDYS